jgi:biotin-dependent carboxylase-like uncharacterized protein
MSIRILEPGFNVTIQDLGRASFQHLGVPVSGAVSPVALKIGNALVGNKPGVACLEIRLIGPTIEVLCDAIRVALTGTITEIELMGKNGCCQPANQSLVLKKGQKFKIGSISDSGSAYLAIEGGFKLPEVYGSLSTYVRGSIGGFSGKALEQGDEIPLNSKNVEDRGELRVSNLAALEENGPLRIIFGPQKDFFKEESIRDFLASPYLITRDADRMGMRLDGPVLKHERGYNIVSDGIVTGAIQVPGTGQPIILLADHQTTGGYPKMATVISADISRMGRLRPGDTVKFIEVTADEAEKARFEHEKMVLSAISGFVNADPWLDEKALYTENLISGFL